MLEIVPAAAFLIGNALRGPIVAAGAASVATAIAVAVRWYWDRGIPWLAVATFVLALVLLIAGLFNDDATFIKIRATIGSIAFGVIVAVGALLRPSLLQRTHGHRLRISDPGWRMLHVAWILLAVLSAAAAKSSGATALTMHGRSTNRFRVWNCSGSTIP